MPSPSLNAINNHQLRKLLIVRQILLESILKFVQRTVWRICTLTLGVKGLSEVERRYTVGYLTNIATAFNLKDKQLLNIP